MDSIAKGGQGPAVEDVQRRLQKLGYLDERDISCSFDDTTAHAVRAFRIEHGLSDDDIVDTVTWAALVDASFSLGDRTLFLRIPYFHGNDVRELQNILNILGFACGPHDAIFGAHTERAVRDFQLNMGIEADGIVGMDTTKALSRLNHAWKDKNPISGEADAGFARAAEVIETCPVCFYGVDEISRLIASRIGNLAFATSSSSKMLSADRLSDAPGPEMVLVEITTESPDALEPVGSPLVEFENSRELFNRLSIALHSLTPSSRRVVISIEAPETFDEAENGDDPSLRFVQHSAIMVLDAICNALR